MQLGKTGVEPVRVYSMVEPTIGASPKQETRSRVSEKNLEKAIGEVEKRFGKGTLVSLNSIRTESFPVISTGNTVIDELTGIGGVPKGRITEVYGPESGGKTTLCLHIIAEAQKAGGVCVYIDAEHALDPEYAGKLGVDVDKLLLCQPDNGEDALEVVLTMVRSGAVAVVVVDSVSALVPRKELEGDIGDAQMGLQARMMSQAMRVVTKAVADTGTVLIFINQVRDKIGVMFGNPETTSGGRALKFAASLRIDVRRISQKKKGDEVIGAVTALKIVKNKLASPYKKAEVLLTYGEGFSNPKEK
jgi:recombination protein RecA